MKNKFRLRLSIFIITFLLLILFLILNKNFFLSKFEAKLRGVVISLVIDTKYEHMARKFYYFIKYGSDSFNDGETLYLSEKYLNSKIENKNNKRENIIGISRNLKDYLVEGKIEIDNWLRSHGGNKNQKFSKSDSINKENIKNLKKVWKYNSDTNKLENIQTNPIFYENYIIAISPDNSLVSLNAINGNINWKKNFSENLLARRGLVLDKQKNGKTFVYVNADRKLYKINTLDGTLDKNFGKKGFIEGFFSLTAPFINKDKLYLTNVTPPTLVIFDKISGEKISKIDLNPKSKNFTGASPWMGTAFDKKNNLAFVSLGNPRPALYGITRPGKNENSNSIVAIDLKSKKIKWSFQEVAHDLWDFDIGCPPLLTEVNYEDKILELVVCVTKIGNTLIFERKTGKPLFDIYYKDTPTSNMPKQETWQQISVKLPENISSVEFSPKSFDKLNKDKKEYINNILEESEIGWFVPPNFAKRNLFFGIHGGSNWFGSANNPYTGQLFTPINHIPYESMLYGTDISSSSFKTSNEYNLYKNNCASCHGMKRNIKIKKNLEQIDKFIPSLVGLTLFDHTKKHNLSFKNFKKKHKSAITKEEYNKLINFFYDWDKELIRTKSLKLNYYWASFLDKKDKNFLSNPPWGEIASLDIKTGKLLWRTPIGIDKENDENLVIGTSIYGGCSVNRNNILFCVGTDDAYIYALDGYNGEILWKHQMDFAGTAPPLIYEVNDREFVTIVASGSNIVSKNRTRGNQIITFSLD